MRICHLTSTHGNRDQRILLKECASLARAGYEVYQVAQGENGEYNGVKLVGTGETGSGAFRRLIVRPRNVYKLAKKLDADIYQIHDMELLPYAVKLKRKGKSVIFDYHEDFASRFADTDIFHLPKFVMRLLGKMYTAYEKRSIKKLDAMISVTPHICKRLKESNPNTVMVTNYPIIEEGNSWSSPAEYNRSSDYVCFAGQISCVQYGLDTAVKAIQSTNGITLKLYGHERRAGDVEYLKSLDTAKKMTYCGSVPFFELPAILSGSRAAVVTGAYTKDTNGHEGTLGNNKLFESMLRGIPVICTDYDLWKDINERFHFGICVEFGNTAEMESALKQILANPDEAAEMGKRGREAVLNEYNWLTQEAVLLKLYDKIKTLAGN